MKKLCIIILLSCLFLIACENNTNADLEAMQDKVEELQKQLDELQNTENAITTTIADDKTEITETIEMIESTESTYELLEKMRNQIDAKDTSLSKLDCVNSLYEEYSDTSFPVIKEFISDMDLTDETDELWLSNFDELLIALYNNGESDFVEETLVRLFKATDNYNWTARLLANKDTYLSTALAALTHSQSVLNDNFYQRSYIWQYAFSSYITQFNTIDDELKAVKELTEKVFSLMPEEKFIIHYNSKDGYRDFTDFMPPLSAAVTQSPQNIKCLVVFRNNRENDFENWHLDLGVMPFLPAYTIPESISEANVLITIDTRWEYAFDYSGGIKAYKAISSIMVYDMATGFLISNLGERVNSPNIIYNYFGEPPEEVYVNIYNYPELSYIWEYIDGYLKGNQ